MNKYLSTLVIFVFALIVVSKAFGCDVTAISNKENNDYSNLIKNGEDELFNKVLLSDGYIFVPKRFSFFKIEKNKILMDTIRKNADTICFDGMISILHSLNLSEFQSFKNIVEKIHSNAERTIFKRNDFDIWRFSNSTFGVATSTYFLFKENKYVINVSSSYSLDLWKNIADSFRKKNQGGR